MHFAHRLVSTRKNNDDTLGKRRFIINDVMVEKLRELLKETPVIS